MKDLAQLAFYTILTVAAILLLVAMSRMESLPSSALVGTAMLLIIVIPVVIAVRMGKKEQARKNKKNAS